MAYDGWRRPRLRRVRSSVPGPRSRGPGRSGRSGPARGCRRGGPLDERLDLLLLARDLDHQLLGADVDDPAAEDLHQPLDLGPSAAGASTLISIRSRSTIVLARDVEDLDDRDDLLELLADLLEVAVVAHHDDRDPREVRVLRLADGEAVDVEPARGEHPRDVRQHARPVLHQRREHMSHPAALVGFPGRWGGRTETLTRWSRHRRFLMPA